MGIGIGAKNATVPIFSSELAPHRTRGALVMFWQLWVVAGIFLGFSANVIVKDTGSIAWRLQLGSAFIPALVLVLGVWFCPESPRWLMKHGKYDKAFQSFLRIRAHPIIAARDYYYSYVIYQQEREVAGGGSYFTRMRDIFTIPRIRRANYGASTVMIAQQMCGINSELRAVVCAHPASHLFLFEHHLPECRIQCRASLVRLSWLRCYSSRLHNPDIVFDRSRRSKALVSHREYWSKQD